MTGQRGRERGRERGPKPRSRAGIAGTVYPRGKKWAYAVTLAPDPRDSAAVAAVVTETVQRHGRLDLMVNNAGIGIGGDAEELAVAHWDRVIDVNLRGVVHGVQAAYR